MTQEEAGLEMFAAIALAGKIQACQKQYAIVVHRGNQEEVAAKKKELTTLREVLCAQFATLHDSDAAEFARRYPWVLT